MTRYERCVQGLAVCLVALAGFIDAVGFIQLGGFLVSFMSGNSTWLAVGIARQGVHRLRSGIPPIRRHSTELNENQQIAGVRSAPIRALAAVQIL